MLACCVYIIDLGTHLAPPGSHMNYMREIAIGWELLDINARKQSGCRILYKKYPLQLTEGSPLKSEIENIFNEKLPANWARRFNIKSLLGTYCILLNENFSENDGTDGFSKIALQRLQAGIEHSSLPKPRSPFGIFMCSEPDLEFLRSLPPNIQTFIASSVEFSRS